MTTVDDFAARIRAAREKIGPPAPAIVAFLDQLRAEARDLGLDLNDQATRETVLRVLMLIQAREDADGSTCIVVVGTLGYIGWLASEAASPSRGRTGP